MKGKRLIVSKVPKKGLPEPVPPELMGMAIPQGNIIPNLHPLMSELEATLFKRLGQVPHPSSLSPHQKEP
jgi:hypothetical protein